MIKIAKIVLMSCCLYCGIGLGAEADLGKDDPLKVTRTQSPIDDFFVREIEMHQAVFRLSVVSKKLKQDELSLVGGDNSGTRFIKWEWQDVTGDGRVEFLVWFSFQFGKGVSSHLDIYRFVEDAPGFSAERIASIMYSRKAHHVYPSQPQLSGELVVGKERIDWKAKADNKSQPEAIEWTWDAQERKFKPTEL
jgi:hypothetical protein